MVFDELDRYKQQVADLYSNRRATYDRGDWHPRIAQRLVEHAAQAMNFHPEECAVIEDSEVGLIAATKAGMQTYFFNPQNLECKINDVISFDRMIDLPLFFDASLGNIVA